MLRSRFYPLHSLPNQGQLWSWISFDVANQSFTLIINTLLFSIFFQQIVVRDATRDDFLWNAVYAVSMGLVVIASPVAGAIADERAWKKPCLVATGLICAALTCGLAFIQPGQLWLAALLYIPANFMFSIGENFLASFLPEVSPREHLGRVDAAAGDRFATDLSAGDISHEPVARNGDCELFPGGLAQAHFAVGIVPPSGGSGDYPERPKTRAV